VRTASRGQVYLGGALWQMLQSAVSGVDESAMVVCVLVRKRLVEGKCHSGIELACESCDVFSLRSVNSVLFV